MTRPTIQPAADQTSSFRLRGSWLLIGAVIVGGWLFVMACGPSAWVPAAAVALTEGLIVAAVFVSAGGWGWLAMQRWIDREAPLGLRVASYAGAGLLGYWTLLLIVASTLALPGSWLCGAGVAAGVGLAGWASRKIWATIDLSAWRGSGVWIALGGAAGLVLAGAMRPAGWIAMPDAYDVLEYHLQVPREWYHAGLISPLQHNVYSHYPLGVETLYLLVMQLRGGPWEAMYTAKLLHVGFGVLAVIAIYGGTQRDPVGRSRGRFAAALLATTPGVLYVGWLAFSELAMLAYLAIALLWLQRWGDRPAWATACGVGLFAGAACGTKYLAVGFVAAPLLVSWMIATLRTPRRLGQVATAGLIVLAVLSPWLVRNLAATGNPVFPLATSLFGRGHWTAQLEQRWVDGHGPNFKPPVPTRPGWQRPDRPTRLESVWQNFFVEQRLGPMTLIIAGVSLAAVLATSGGLGRCRWDWLLAGVLVIQLAVWAAFTHGLPWRFILPAMVPVCLLAGGGLARLGHADLIHRTFRTLPWERIAVAVVLGVALIANLLLSYGLYVLSIRVPDVPPFPAHAIAEQQPPYAAVAQLPPDSRVLLIGDATAWYYPPETVYATVFDHQMLASLADRPGEAILARLSEQGITHLLLRWDEIWRLTATYGIEPTFSEGLWQRYRQGKSADLPILKKLRRAGMKRTAVGPRQTDRPEPPADHWRPYRMPAHWPLYTLYELPAN